MAEKSIDIRALEQKVDELIALCDKLEQENTVLNASKNAWQDERARLIEKNELAKSKVESMIARLKALEQDGG